MLVPEADFAWRKWNGGCTPQCRARIYDWPKHEMFPCPLRRPYIFSRGLIRLFSTSSRLDTSRPSQRTILRPHLPQAPTVSARMASTGLETDLRNLSLVQSSYPQAKEADSDPIKLSSSIFSNVEVCHATCPLV